MVQKSKKPPVTKIDDPVAPKRRGRPRAYEPDVALGKALDLFRKDGFAATSLDDLSAATGMNRPSLYGAFGDKRELYIKSYQRYRADARAAMLEIFRDELPIRNRLQRVVDRNLFREKRDYPLALRNIANAIGARAHYGVPAIVVDLGTATTFDCINARGEFIGGAIAPGISTASDALLNRAARLFRVELVRPKDAIGRDTVSNIQSGIVYGWAGLVDGIVERMKAEMDGTPRVIATGGQAGLIANVARSIQDVHEHLAFEGLRLLWERAHPS